MSDAPRRSIQEPWNPCSIHASQNQPCRECGLAAEKDALRERLRKDAEASARRPRHERRHMPAIAKSMACDNCGTSARVYSPECCHVQGCHLCVIPPAPIRCQARCGQYPNCQHDWSAWRTGTLPCADPEPRPGDGPEFRAEHQAWRERHDARRALKGYGDE